MFDKLYDERLEKVLEFCLRLVELWDLIARCWDPVRFNAKRKPDAISREKAPLRERPK